jgi:hypothetical protein
MTDRPRLYRSSGIVYGFAGLLIGAVAGIAGYRRMGPKDRVGVSDSDLEERTRLKSGE